MCVWKGGALEIHLEANGVPAWKSLGTAAAICNKFLKYASTLNLFDLW